MRSIRVSDEVWEAIAASGRFGETEDDVLRRLLGVDVPRAAKGTTPPAPALAPSSARPRPGHSVDPMSAEVQNDLLTVSFRSGSRKNFPLPKRTDVEGIRRVRAEAVRWARANGASSGQEDAVKKALTEAGYHIRGPRR